MSRVLSLLTAARFVLETQGAEALLRRGFAFVFSQLFERRVYYLYADPLEDLRNLNEADFLPKVDSFDFRIVHSNEQADELEKCGLEFRSRVLNAAHKLDGGAIALLIFVEKKPVHANWLALDERAQRALGEPPYKVDYLNHEACSTGLWTHPRYRQRGLRRYARFRMLQFLHDRGIHTKRAAIEKRNVIAQQGRREYPHGPYAEGRHLKVLWWKSWKETLLESRSD